MVLSSLVNVLWWPMHDNMSSEGKMRTQTRRLWVIATAISGCYPDRSVACARRRNVSETFQLLNSRSSAKFDSFFEYSGRDSTVTWNKSILNYKPLYLLNYMIYHTQIRRSRCKFWLNFVLPLLMNRSVSTGFFYWRTLYITRGYIISLHMLNII